jgi:hypothetical protein
MSTIPTNGKSGAWCRHKSAAAGDALKMKSKKIIFLKIDF